MAETRKKPRPATRRLPSFRFDPPAGGNRSAHTVGTTDFPFGAQLRCARALTMLDKADVAHAVGISVATLSRIEAKDGLPSVRTKTLEQLASYYQDHDIFFIASPNIGIGLTSFYGVPDVRGSLAASAHGIDTEPPGRKPRIAKEWEVPKSKPAKRAKSAPTKSKKR